MRRTVINIQPGDGFARCGTPRCGWSGVTSSLRAAQEYAGEDRSTYLGRDDGIDRFSREFCPGCDESASWLFKEEVTSEEWKEWITA